MAIPSFLRQDIAMDTTFDDPAAIQRSMRASQRKKTWRALLLVGPLAIFLLVIFVIPIASLLTRAADNPEVIDTLPGTLQALRISDPADQNEAKFCAKYILACAWLDGAVTLGHFSRLSIQREDVRVMMGRIEIEEEPSPGTDIERGTVSVIITGQPLSITNQKHFPGSPAWPASAEQLWAKIDDCLVASGKTAEQLRNEVKKLLCW